MAAMTMMHPVLLLVCVFPLLASVGAGGGEVSPDRGRDALLSASHISAMWPVEAYDKVWEVWGVAERPTNYAAAFQERYGLHPAPYENDGLPMGLRRAEGNGRAGGLAIDCMLCHGGAALGTSHVGLPNTTIDLPQLFNDLYRAGGSVPFPWPFPLARSRGTTNAGAVAAFVLAFRNPDLTPRFPPAKLGWRFEIVAEPPEPGSPPREVRKVYDTTLFGKGNGGHPFGDALNEEERRAVIEYLKTL